MIKHLFLIVTLLSFSQEKKFVYPEFIGNTLHNIESNPKWKIIEKASGDLNGDGVEDVSLIIESRDLVLEKRCQSCKLRENKARIILVLFSDKVVIQNNTFIARYDEGGMALSLEPVINIQNNLLSIFYHYTRDFQSYTFQFDNEKMKIISSEKMSVHPTTGNYEHIKSDFFKNEIIVKKGNISLEKESVEILKINVKSKSLSEFKTMYDWEVADDIYL